MRNSIIVTNTNV